MKPAEQRKEHRLAHFEADIEDTIDALFRRHPALCGFLVRDAANAQDDTLAPRDSGELFLTEVSVYPMRDPIARSEVCHEIVETLAKLIDKCPEASTLLRDRAFARVFH